MKDIFLTIVAAATACTLGILIGTAMMQPAPCPECQQCLECKNDCTMQEARLSDQRNLFTKQLEQKQEELQELHKLGTSLWNDYWYCNISYECIGEEERCFEDYNLTNTDLSYYNSKCWYAENYNKYLEEFWEGLE